MSKTKVQNLAKSKRTECCTLCLATGSGKTKIGVDIAQEYNRVLIVVPTANLRDTRWPDEFKKWDKPLNFEATCYQSLTKHDPNDYDLVILDEVHHLTLKNSQFFSTIDDDYNFIRHKYQGAILGLTATPPKDEHKKILLDEIAPVIFEYGLEEAVEDNVVSPYKINIVKFSLSEEKNIKVKNFHTSEKRHYNYLTDIIEKDNRINVIKYKQNSLVIDNLEYELKEKDPKFDCDDYYLIIRRGVCGYLAMKDGELFGKISHNNKNYTIKHNDLLVKSSKMMYLKRMRFLHNIKSKVEVARKTLAFYIKDSRCLIYAGSIKQADDLCENTFHSKTTDEDFNKFVNKDISRLASVGKLNEGVDLPEIDSVLITKLNSNPLNLIQQIGRAVRFREGHRAKIWILCARNTQEEVWLEKSLDKFNSKINYFEY